MTAVVVLGVIALFAAIVAWMTWHRGADERQSVQHHQHTLETLRQVADGRPVSTRRASRRDKGAFTEAVVSPPTAVRNHTAPTALRRTGPRLPGGVEQARRDGRARVRRTRLIAGAVVIVVAGAVGAELALGRSEHPTRTASSGTTHPARPLTSAGGAVSSTTVLSADLTPTGVTAFNARYAIPTTTYTVAIHASASCWVMATDPVTGKVVWTGTIASGASQSVPGSGSLHVQLGAPTDASVTLDGRPVQLPANFRSPFTLEFETAS
ncbi:MAG TPA: DUF4115 domain-containing protein [Acidimicrobiales bacterium]|nr:DUF4115 domain-containing protein [Acidimicrobiales bacterium]